MRFGFLSCGLMGVMTLLAPAAASMIIGSLRCNHTRNFEMGPPLVWEIQDI